MINEGYYFSIVPEVKYSSHIREIVRQIPLKQLLTETDNPGGPTSYSGKLGMPNLIKCVVEEIAKIKGESCKRIEKTVEDNLIHLAGPSAENIFPDLL
jgi:TatD DNase family protein